MTILGLLWDNKKAFPQSAHRICGSLGPKLQLQQEAECGHVYKHNLWHWLWGMKAAELKGHGERSHLILPSNKNYTINYEILRDLTKVYNCCHLESCFLANYHSLYLQGEAIITICGKLMQSMKVQPKLHWRSRILEIPGTWDVCSGE